MDILLSVLGGAIIGASVVGIFWVISADKKYQDRLYRLTVETERLTKIVNQQSIRGTWLNERVNEATGALQDARGYIADMPRRFDDKRKPLVLHSIDGFFNRIGGQDTIKDTLTKDLQNIIEDDELLSFFTKKPGEVVPIRRK